MPKHSDRGWGRQRNKGDSKTRATQFEKNQEKGDGAHEPDGSKGKQERLAGPVIEKTTSKKKEKTKRRRRKRRMDHRKVGPGAFWGILSSPCGGQSSRGRDLGVNAGTDLCARK